MAKNLKFDVDEVFMEAGEFGPYQLFVFVMVGLTSIVPAILVYGDAFVSGQPDFRYNNCMLHISNQNK